MGMNFLDVQITQNVNIQLASLEFYKCNSTHGSVRATDRKIHTKQTVDFCNAKVETQK